MHVKTNALRMTYLPTIALGAICSLTVLVSTAPSQTVGGGMGALRTWEGEAKSDHLGYAVARAGDVNGDGFDDILGSAEDASPNGVQTSGSVYLWSGLDGLLIHQWDGTQVSGRFGDAVDGGGDVNADGVPDVIISAWSESANGFGAAGAVYVYSGSDCGLLYSYGGKYLSHSLGSAVSMAGVACPRSPYS